MPTHWDVIDEERGIYRWEYFLGEMSVSTIAIRCENEKLLIISPGIKPTEGVFEELDALGEVSWVLAPNQFHHLGIPYWQKQYPKLLYFCQQKAKEKFDKLYPACQFRLLEELRALLPKDIEVIYPPHLKSAETITRVRTSSGWCWFINDIILHMQSLPSSFFSRLMTKWIGAPGLKRNRLFATLFVKHRKNLKAWLLQEFESHPPSTVLFGHGTPLSGNDVERVIELVKTTF